MTNEELDKMRDEVLRKRFLELLWDVCQHDKARYVGWLETIAESRLPTDAMRSHLASQLRWNAADAEPLPLPPESEDQRRARLALDRAAAFRDGTP